MTSCGEQCIIIYTCDLVVEIRVRGSYFTYGHHSKVSCSRFTIAWTCGPMGGRIRMSAHHRKLQ